MKSLFVQFVVIFMKVMQLLKNVRCVKRLLLSLTKW